MKWVIVQAVLFAGLIFIKFETNFQVDAVISRLLSVAGVVGFAIGLLAIFNLRHSLSIAPKPVSNGRLQETGIYKFIRHPMYVAVWLIMGGPAIQSGSYLKLGLFAALVVFFVVKTRHEERLLIQKYPGYREYMERVGAYWPKLFT